MNTQTINILLIEDNPGDARLIQEYLKNASQTGKIFEIYWATSLLDGLEKLASTKIDVVLADLGLPDSQGITTLEKLVIADPMLPIVVVTGLAESATGICAVQAGAQDYLVKGHIDEQLLIRTIHHAIERKEVINQKSLITRILSIINRPNSWQKLLKEILVEIKDYAHIEAVGIRLKLEHDYPYFESIGFSDDFRKSENYLCTQNESGEPIFDDHGIPVLECMCGNVIQGRTDPSLPFFTSNGSFWTNSTTRFIAENSQTNDPSRYRNRCNDEGFESVALIPLRCGEEVIGLLQLNDKTPNRFTLSMIAFFEEIGSTLGIAFSRMKAERKVQERIKELNVLHNLSIMAEISSTIEEYTTGILDMIPMGFQNAERTFIRLEIEGKSYQTEEFPDHDNLYGSDILFDGRKLGRIDISIAKTEKIFSGISFLQEEKEMIITISKQIGDFVGRKRSDHIQRAIHAIAAFTNTTGSLEELVMFIQKQLSSFIDTTNFYIAMYDESTDLITIPYFADQKDSITSFPAGKTLTAYVIRTKKPLLGRRTDLDQLAADGTIETIGEKAKVWLGVPLMIKGKVIGVFVVQSYTDENAYTENDLVVLEMVSQQISISVERKKAESDLIEALEKAQESDRVKSAFLATMSHEIRTPLNAVIGFSQLIDAETPMDDILEFVKHINKGGYHLLEIIEDILHISVLESGSVKITNGNHSLLQLMDQIDRTIRGEQVKMQKQHLEIRSVFADEDKKLWILADKEKLLQILMNLLKNALKFTPHGSVEYGVVKGDLDDRKSLRFWVRDTGIGIPDKVKGIIFDIFRQADESHTRIHGGTGLGLAVTSKLVELMGGAIWLESEEGKGSTFYVSIPVEYMTQGEKTEKPDILLERENVLSGKTLLIAEDEDSNYELLEILLTAKGFNVLWAENGRQAVRLCAEHPETDLILMDLKMPVMNGFEASRLIREENPTLPIIAQTAYAMPADRDAAMEAGCNELITKPIKKVELFNAIGRWLR